uniref:Organic cation/carnitine transporter 4 n=1 Tax=Pteris vittata TaxID=13821 RepID=A0A4P8K809_PTEVI|nr:organic cation/carnitine transporter 4 [Pteris vittata]
MQQQQGSDAVEPLLPEHNCKLEKLSIDEVLHVWAGEWGPAQVVHFMLLSLVWCLHGVLTFTMVFADRNPQWVCTAQASVVDAGAAPLCTPSSSICSLDPSQWNWAHGDIESIVSQWGLTCSHNFKVGLVQCFFFMGTLLGCGVWRVLSDSFLGRKGVLIATSFLGSILGMLTAFAPNYWAYVALRTATGFTVGGMGTSAFVLVTELGGSSKGGPISMSILFFYSCSLVYIAALAYFIHFRWRLLYLLSSAPFGLYCLVILPWMSESPRWYLARGNSDAALAILKQVALRNGRTIPATITLKLDHAIEPQDRVVDVLRNAGTMDIFRISLLRKRMMAMLFIWLSCGLSYYGINLNVPNVGGDILLGLISNAVGGIAAFVVMAMMVQKHERRPVLICALLVCGVSSLGAAFAREARARMGYEMMAIFGAAGVYNLAYIYTAELFPTEVRNAAMGLVALAAQVGSIAAPLVAMASNVHGWLPFTIFCITSIMSCCLACWCLPKTLEKPLHENIKDMLKFKDPP